jgi:hypothetical protein
VPCIDTKNLTRREFRGHSEIVISSNRCRIDTEPSAEAAQRVSRSHLMIGNPTDDGRRKLGGRRLRLDRNDRNRNRRNGAPA